jgi:hypothetical protein
MVGVNTPTKVPSWGLCWLSAFDAENNFEGPAKFIASRYLTGAFPVVSCAKPQVNIQSGRT